MNISKIIIRTLFLRSKVSWIYQIKKVIFYFDWRGPLSSGGKCWNILLEDGRLFAGLYWEAAPVTVYFYDPIFCPARPGQLFPGEDEVFWLDTETSEASECNKLEHQHSHHRLRHHHHQSHYPPRACSDYNKVYSFCPTNKCYHIKKISMQNTYLLVFQTTNFASSPFLMTIPPINKRLVSPDEK